MACHTSEGGKEWTEVSIPGLERALISIIELSAHDAATAYVAATRYKHDDFRPFAYVTRDYGKTWTSISSDLPAYGNVNSVRQDPRNRSLLYATTEFGFFVSLDNGASWQSLQQNLPATPVTDMSSGMISSSARSVTKAMRRPSGDHWGCRAPHLSFVRRRKFLPSASTT